MRPNSSIGPKSPMQAVLDAHPGARDALFARFHIGGCATCGYDPNETVAEVARRNALDLAEVLETIRTSQFVPPKYTGLHLPLTAAAPPNRGPMDNADAVGTVGNANCGEMMTIWLRYKEANGRKVIGRASFESFGCDTAIGLASRATEIVRGKTIEEALRLSGAEFASEGEPLPPIKVHCAQLVEGALRAALLGEPGSPSGDSA